MTRMERKRRRARRRRMQVAATILMLCIAMALCTSLTNGDGTKEPEDAADAATLISATAYARELDVPIARTLEYQQTYLVHNDTIPADVPMLKAAVPEPEPLYSEEDVIALAQMAYGEAWITQSDTEMSACMWVVLNRLDSGDRFYAGRDTVYEIITQPRQFHGYDPDNPIEDRLVELARDVLDRWSAEKAGATDVGRTLPAEYCFFYGDGWENHFTTEYHGGTEYDWSLPSPYES